MIADKSKKSDTSSSIRENTPEEYDLQIKVAFLEGRMNELKTINESYIHNAINLVIKNQEEIKNLIKEMVVSQMRTMISIPELLLL
ncbi:MAG: hypothetical protein AAGI23_21965 [Bacteroidota bacterium]